MRRRPMSISMPPPRTGGGGARPALIEGAARPAERRRPTTTSIPSRSICPRDRGAADQRRGAREARARRRRSPRAGGADGGPRRSRITSQSGSVAMMSAAMPDGIVVSAQTTPPLPQPISRTPTIAAARHCDRPGPVADPVAPADRDRRRGPLRRPGSGSRRRRAVGASRSSRGSPDRWCSRSRRRMPSANQIGAGAVGVRLRGIRGPSTDDRCRSSAAPSDRLR